MSKHTPTRSVSQKKIITASLPPNATAEQLVAHADSGCIGHTGVSGHEAHRSTVGNRRPVGASSRGTGIGSIRPHPTSVWRKTAGSNQNTFVERKRITALALKTPICEMDFGGLKTLVQLAPKQLCSGMLSIDFFDIICYNILK